jgi:hypothetical protein
MGPMEQGRFDRHEVEADHLAFLLDQNMEE